MSSLALILAMVSLTLCCSATMTPEKVVSMETTTQLHVTATPVIGPKCAKPPKKENAIFLGNWNEETYPHNHLVTYSCRPGYVLSRRIKMICLKGKWEPISNGHCIKRSCGHPGDIPFGTFVLRYEEEFVFGAMVEYSCDQGFQMVSRQTTRTCASNGWTNQPPHCEARLCPPVWDDSVKVLTYVNDDEFTMSQVIHFKCRDPRRRLKGPSMIFCMEHGTWDKDPPTCKNDVITKNVKGSCTVQENDMRKNNIKLKDNKKIRFEDNENVQFECVSRHNISDPTKLMIRCNNGILKYPTCNRTVKTLCGRPPQIKHGEITSLVRESYPLGSTVKYVCPLLYKLQGPKVIKCQGGTWNHPPVCLEPCTTSEESMRINHLTLMWPQKKKDCVRNSQKRKHAKKCYISQNDTIQFTCLPGYKISDPKEFISRCDRGVLPYPRCFKIK